MARTGTEDDRYTVTAYFDLVRRGVLGEDDRVELLDGVVVAEPPSDPPHAAAVEHVASALRIATSGRAAVHTQAPFIASAWSAPEPEVAVVPGTHADYWNRHPIEAFLVVEVAGSSLPQDRLSKSRIYAGAGVPEYWIVNLRQGRVEIHRQPDVARRLFSTHDSLGRDRRLDLIALRGASVACGKARRAALCCRRSTGRARWTPCASA